MLKQSWFVVRQVRRWIVATGAVGVAGFLMMIVLQTSVYAKDKASLNDDLVVFAGFEGSMDASVIAANGDGTVYTADSPARKVVERGNHIPEVTIAKNAGRLGDALRFSAKTDKVLCYKAASNGFEPQDNWSGTVSLWLKLNADADLPAGYCDPLQITSKKWDDASFFFDFDQTLPRDFRLGVFSDFEFWNPAKVKWDDISVSDRPMVVVNQPPFSRDQWTHVVFTFDNLNATTDKVSTASLYVNGKLQGTVKRPMRFTWTKCNDGASEAMIMLGINYVGDMDELKIYRRALTADEVEKLFKNP